MPDREAKAERPGGGVRELLTADAVRARAHDMLALGEAGKLIHFTVNRDRLAACAEYVIATTVNAYPTLDVPFHARWRHFAAGGLDRWRTLERATRWSTPAERGRAAFDLAIVSVLLDAGAGADWSYREGETGETYGRSEGLGVASFRMFEAGLFSADPAKPLRADADRLAALTADDLAAGFQVSAANPLVGLEGRTALLNRLGRTAAANPAAFALNDTPRPGGLFDLLARDAKAERLPAHAILHALLTHLGPIWPGRIARDGLDLGDTWTHPLIAADETDGTAGLVPFHKLSQWLSYSLIEPLEEAGIAVVAIDRLTGLPEYRNGGLFLDAGVIALKDEGDADRAHEVGSPLVVEWRALTVALLDELAAVIRERMDVEPEDWPLAKILEGGTWAAGRRIARETRPGGPPPLTVVSDGTVF